ncbi:hypothetical protein Hhis01_00928 [Haloarcula hispanica]
MKRRQLLRYGGLGCSIALAGCFGGAPGSGETSTEGASETPSVNETTFSVTQRQSGSQTSSATVAFDGDQVVVEGTIWGSDGCKTADLTDVTYDSSADELRISVGTKDKPDAGDVCTQAIMEIDYRATATFENGLPGTVSVSHDTGDGQSPVTTATR